MVITAGDSNRYKFTGKERDSESGLDNFGKRYNASSLGRFMTPDPLLNSGQPLESAELESLLVHVKQSTALHRSNWPLGLGKLLWKCRQMQS